jgi:thioglycine synthase
VTNNLENVLESEFGHVSSLFDRYISTDSRILSDSHAAHPEHAYSLISSWSKSIGRITRLAENTGLDRLSIPNFYAVRPSAAHPSVIVSSGKGTNRPSAVLSALFEAYERWSAESVGSKAFATSKAQLATFLPDNVIIAPEGIPADSEYLWTVGFDLVNRRPCVQLLQQAVFPPHQFSEIPPGVTTDTNGLAAGTNPLEAMCAAILELIERDAIRRINPHSFARLTIRSLPHSFQELSTTFSKAGVDVAVISCPSPTSIPVIYCMSRDKLFNVSSMFCSGSGAHTNLVVALFRALTEVAQSRVGFIAALRDDVSAKVSYYSGVDYISRRIELEQWFSAPQSDASSHLTPVFESFRELFEYLTQQVAMAYKSTPIVCIPLRNITGLFAFRVYAPQMLGLSPNLCKLNGI